MKFLADPRKRRQWVLILLKELFYVKSRAGEIPWPLFNSLASDLPMARLIATFVEQYTLKSTSPYYLILPRWQKTELMNKRSSIKASFKESYRLKTLLTNQR